MKWDEPIGGIDLQMGHRDKGCSDKTCLVIGDGHQSFSFALQVEWSLEEKAEYYKYYDNWIN